MLFYERFISDESSMMYGFFGVIIIIAVILVIGGVILFNSMSKNTTVPDNNVGSTPYITPSEDKQQNTENEKVDEDL